MSIRRTFARLFWIITTVTLLSSSTPVFAGGFSQYPIEVSVSGGSATADGGSKITFSLYIYGYRCPNGSGGYYTTDISGPCSSDGSTPTQVGEPETIGIYPSGSGNVLGGTTSEGNNIYSVQADASGHAQFTLASTVAETKTLTFTDQVRTQPYADAPTKSVTFTAAPAATAPTTTPKKTTTTQTTPTAAAAQPPEAPKTSGVEIAGQAVTDTQHIVLADKQPLTLTGTTVPNGVVKLYIFSTPREATVTADSKGAWSYTVSGLEAGSHHVEAAVTDPATNQTSSRATLAAFTIKAPVKTTAATRPAKKSRTGLWLSLGAAAAVIIIAGAVVWWRVKRKRQATLTAANTTPMGTPSETANPDMHQEDGDQPPRQ
jgi:Big-like domain-containing protein